MITKKQIEELGRLRRTLGSIGKPEAPSLERHVMVALVSGEMPKLKSAKSISDKAREKIISSQYTRALSFGDVFASCNGYEAEMSVFKAYEKQRANCLKKFERKADAIMLAAMNEDADSSSISEQLHTAADESGLRGLVAPKFGKVECDDE